MKDSPENLQVMRDGLLKLIDARRNRSLGTEIQLVRIRESLEELRDDLNRVMRYLAKEQEKKKKPKKL